MQVVVSGASGLIGSALVPALRAQGHTVKRLVRRDVQADDELSWDPTNDVMSSRSLAGTDAVINLAGAGVGDQRWTEQYKRVIRESRVRGTKTLAAAIARMPQPPKVFISASAIGYYGDRGDEELDESAAKGTGFLSDVVADWEDASHPVTEVGVRVVNPRTGLVVSSAGGAWGRLIPLFSFGLGGRLGSGKQYWSFISRHDAVRGLITMLADDRLSGPVNLTAPEAITNQDATKELASALHRPALMRVPAWALQRVLGEFSTESLSSSRVVPRSLTNAGFSWDDPTMEQSLTRALRSDKSATDR